MLSAAGYGTPKKNFANCKVSFETRRTQKAQRKMPLFNNSAISAYSAYSAVKALHSSWKRIR